MVPLRAPPAIQRTIKCTIKRTINKKTPTSSQQPLHTPPLSWRAVIDHHIRKDHHKFNRMRGTGTRRRITHPPQTIELPPEVIHTQVLTS